MVDFRPFRALRYDSSVAGAGASLIAPPYDVVAPEDRNTVYLRGPFNVSLIDYGEEYADDDEHDNRYTRARLDIEAWMKLGVLRRDDEPQLFAYEQEFELAGRKHKRTAIFGRLRLEEWEKGIVLPHEVTGEAAKDDRLRLLQATGMHLSPVLGLYEPSGIEPFSQYAFGEPVFRASFGDTERHVLRPVRADAAEAFVKALSDHKLYIADGHHRYETGLNYRDQKRAEAGEWSGEEPENFILAALVSVADPGLAILPTHRLLKLPNHPADLVSLMTPLFKVEPAGDVSDFSVEQVVAKLAAAGREGPAFATAGLEPGKLHLLTPHNADALVERTPPNRSDRWRRLDVTVLEYAVLLAIGYDGQPEHIDYTEWPYHAATEVAEGRWDVAFLLNPTHVEQVMDIAEAGERMPRKSTFFYPKLATGVVMLPLD
jgi:uncharacterized protein (DUF1015 family)